MSVAKNKTGTHRHARLRQEPQPKTPITQRIDVCGWRERERERGGGCIVLSFVFAIELLSIES